MQDHVVDVVGLLGAAELHLVRMGADCDRDRAGGEELTGPALVADHADAADLRVRDARDRDTLTHERLVLHDDPARRQPDEPGAGADRVVDGDDLFALEEAALDLLKLALAVVHHVCQIAERRAPGLLTDDRPVRILDASGERNLTVRDRYAVPGAEADLCVTV